MPNVFTDKQLSDLYLKLKNDYCIEDTHEGNFHRMWAKLSLAFEPGGLYHRLPEEEKEKVRTVFLTFLNMHNPFTSPQLLSRADLNVQRQEMPSIQVYHVDCHHYNDNWFQTFLLWELLTDNRQNTSNSSNESSHKSKGPSEGEKIFFTIVVAIILASAILISFYYLLLVLCDGIDRLKNDEGRLYANFSFIMMAASAGAGYLAWGLILVPMLQPVGILALLGLAATMCVTSALTTGLAREIFSLGVQLSHSEVLDPRDPYRFQVPCDDLIDGRFDPVKVRFAMAVMRDEIGALPSALNRFFDSDSKIQEKQRLLELMREFRDGVIPSEGFVVVSGKRIALLRDAPVTEVELQTHCAA